MQYISSNKKMVQILLNQCLSYGVKHAVISPGSRNAPLIISFDNHPDITCYSIADERSAAFYALGMSKQLNEPVAIICTSGTAVLNYAPALTEAYYQEIPLIAITADRPPYLIDQEDGQTIRQENIFANHIRYAVNLPVDENADILAKGTSDIKKALTASLNFPNGPVHINIPFEDPLYNCEDIAIENVKEHYTPNEAKASIPESFYNSWEKNNKIMLLVGVMLPNEKLNHLIINTFAKEYNCAVFAPATANIHGNNIFNTVENLFYTASTNDLKNYKPDLLITFGGPVVSKSAKQFLRKNKPEFHFDIDLNPGVVDTYQSLTAKITMSPMNFINEIQEKIKTKNSAYIELWQAIEKIQRKRINDYLINMPWCDLSLYDALFQKIDRKIDLHLGNSTPVRYAELFAKHPLVNYYSNRGTSGIDGSTSTAAGSALATNNTTLLITGDISFFYDSNAFWNNHIPQNLKIILINNGGGNIFKIINGPDSTNQLESLFVTKQNAKAQKLCEAFNINYLSCTDMKSFSLQLNPLFKNKNCTVLEVFTPAEKSAQIYRDFFTELK